MKNCKYPVFLLFGLVALYLMPTRVMAGPDYGREQRWADEIVPNLFIGEPVYLTQENGHRFLGLYAAASEVGKCIVAAHGMGLHPDWDMIGSLRQRLVDFGYTTLSIQMPILAAEASYRDYPPLFPEAAERLALAVGLLKKKGCEAIAIVSHSNGSRMSRVYMASNPADVKAWVALSLTQGDTFTDIKAPILDLYGEQDLPHVLSAVDKRRASLRNSASKQALVPAADHFFSGHVEAMIFQVKIWLDNILAGTAGATKASRL